MRPALAIAFIAAIGCSGNGNKTGGGGGTGGTGGNGVGGGGPESYSITFGPITVPSGTENTQCIIKRLGNPAPLHVGRCTTRSAMPRTT